MRVHDLLARTADRAPDAVAAIDPGGYVTYAALERRARQVAVVLRDHGVGRGDRVVLTLDNSIGWLAAYFGALKAGATVVPLAGGPKSDRLAHVLADCEPAACITDAATAPLIDQARPDRTVILLGDARGRAADTAVGPVRRVDLAAAADAAPAASMPSGTIDVDLAAIIYTSGSTGRPRGVMLTHLNLTANAESIVAYLRLTPADRVMVVLPFHYIYGLSLLHTHVLAGGAVVIDNRFAFPNVILQTMQRHRVTGFAGVPSTFSILLDRSPIARVSLPTLRYVTQAGGPMSPARIDEWRRVVPAPFYVMYGATEAAGRLSYLDPAELDRRRGSIGRAIPNVELQVLADDGRPVGPGEIGEITARGSNVSPGYWNLPEDTASAFGPHGYRTGDLARVDDDGCLYIVGRRHDMLKIGGHRVSAREIEEAIAEHPAVLEVAVVATAHPVLGEAPVAFVALRGGVAAGVGELEAHCRRRLPDFKVPVRMTLSAELPKTASGKPDKARLRDGGAGSSAPTVAAV